VECVRGPSSEYRRSAIASFRKIGVYPRCRKKIGRELHLTFNVLEVGVKLAGQKLATNPNIAPRFRERDSVVLVYQDEMRFQVRRMASLRAEKVLDLFISMKYLVPRGGLEPPRAC
jgi:hypothetical protein